MLVAGLSTLGSDQTWKCPLRVLTEVTGAIRRAEPAVRGEATRRSTRKARLEMAHIDPKPALLELLRPDDWLGGVALPCPQGKAQGPGSDVKDEHDHDRELDGEGDTFMAGLHDQ
jgi:hypothetical protein